LCTRSLLVAIPFCQELVVQDGQFREPQEVDKATLLIAGAQRKRSYRQHKKGDSHKISVWRRILNGSSRIGVK